MKHKMYLVVAISMLVYALPQLFVGHGLTLPTIFAVIWLLFALLIISAQLHFVLGVDEEMKQSLEQVHQMKKWRRTQIIKGR